MSTYTVNKIAAAEIGSCYVYALATAFIVFSRSPMQFNDRLLLPEQAVNVPLNPICKLEHCIVHEKKRLC